MARPGARLSWLRWPLGAALIVVLWLPNVSRPGTPVEACPGACAAIGVSQHETVRVLTLNTLHGFPRFDHLDQRLDLIADGLLQEQPDLVCLQEISWTPGHGNTAAYLAARAGYTYVYSRANGNRWTILFEEGEAILSRYPLREIAATELLPRAGLFEHRIALQAVAATPLGDVRIVATHLADGDAGVNERQAAALTDFVTSSPYPTVVCGDLNATEDTPQIRSLSASMVDAYRVARPDAPGLTCCVDDLSDPVGTFNKRIDYIFVTRENPASLDVVSARTLFDRPYSVEDGWHWASDHGGLIIDLAKRK